MIDQNAIINDPKYVPFITHEGQCLISHDDRILIISSSLAVRFLDATGDGKTATWLKTPPRYLRGGRR